MCVAPRNLGALIFGAASLLPLACKDSTSPKTGSIEVTVATVGQGGDRDRDGYVVRLDGNSETDIGVNAVVTIADVSTGTHQLLLDGVEANCTVSGTNPRSVNVSAGSPIPVAFFVSCAARTGTINVSVTTSGPDADADGYTVIVGGAPRGNLLPNGSISIPGLNEGPWGVSLSGVALNCSVEAPILKTVNVELAKSVQVAFIVRCVQTVSLRVTARTTGVDLDSDGYAVLVQIEGGSATRQVPINGTVTITSLAPANYDLTLQSVAANCNPVTPSRQRVAVFANPTDVTLEVQCETARQLAYVNTIGVNGNIHVINSNSTDDHVIASDPTADIDPGWSPDGSKIVFASRRSGNYDIYVMGADGANPVRLTTSAADDYGPTWSPDGARIAFVSQRDLNPEIYVMNADGSNQVRLTNSVVSDFDPAWSPNGAKIALSSNNGLAVMNSDGSGLTQLTTNSRGDLQPAWSPDGTRIAFSRGLSASVRDIFTINPDGTGLVALTAGLSAMAPAWSPDGRKIAFGGLFCDAYYYYVCGSQIMIVGLDGTVYTPLATTGAATNPSWRP